ncbi:MAG: F0F1 ATP synthase subunit B [Bacteroidales bacterium]|nr:F0F1 ATP synthase subunit B [Bacteroidales bacterium]
MDLINPGVGLLFWMTLAFLILVFVLGKFAWKPILNAINKRNQSIEDALNAAEEARLEMQKLKADNETILAQARAERDEILKEAKEFSNKIIAEAKEATKSEIDNMKEIARQEIAHEKATAIGEIKGQVAGISIQIAEKLLKRELDEKDKQEQFVNEIIKDINLN